MKHRMQKMEGDLACFQKLNIELQKQLLSSPNLINNQRSSKTAAATTSTPVSIASVPMITAATIPPTNISQPILTATVLAKPIPPEISVQYVDVWANFYRIILFFFIFYEINFIFKNY